MLWGSFINFKISIIKLINLGTLKVFSKNIYPRFKARKLFNKFRLDLDVNNSEVYQLIKETTYKDIILDYSQLRIGLLHYLKIALPKNALIATTSYTIFDMVNIILNSENKPIFVDIEKENLGPSRDQLINLVINREVDCIIYTYLHGYKTDIYELSKICKKYGCILIEDCAQSLWNFDKPVKSLPGSFGDVALFSTGLYKNINSISGGILCLNSYDQISSKLLKEHKKLNNFISKDFLYRFFYSLFFEIITNKYVFSLVTFQILKFGFNKNLEFINKRAREENNPRYIKRSSQDILKMNFIQKLLIIFKTKKSLIHDFQIKNRLAQIYLENLDNRIINNYINIPGLNKDFNYIEFKKISSNNQIPIICKNRDRLLKYLINNNFDIAAQHIKNLSSVEIYSSFQKEKIHYSELISQSLILLPCYPGFPSSEAKKISKYINKFYLQNNGK